MNLHDTTELALQEYSESRTMRALLRLFPGGGALDGVLSQTYASMTQEREDTLFKALEERRASISDDYARSNTFVRRFMITYDAVLRETEYEKVELFANLLTNAPTETQLDESTYKALQQILNELSVREIALLKMVEDVPSQGDDWSAFVARTETELGIPRAEFLGVVSRLARTGCYVERPNNALGGAGSKGSTTGLWQRFKAYVLERRGA